MVIPNTEVIGPDSEPSSAASENHPDEGDSKPVDIATQKAESEIKPKGIPSFTLNCPESWEVFRETESSVDFWSYI